jgi:WD40 repeat protein
VSRDRTARLWYPNGYQHAFFPHTGDIRHAAISPDERWLATAGTDSAARVWATTADNPVAAEAEKRRETLRLGHSGSVTHVAFERDGRHLLTAGVDGYLRRWSLAPDPLFQALPTEWLNKLAIAPNGASVVTAGGNYSPGLWTLEGDTLPRRLAPHEDDLSDASYSTDGRWLATSDNRRTTIVFSTDAYTPIRRFPGRYSAVGRDVLVTSGNGRTLQRFTLPSGERLEDIETSAEIQALAISSANQVAAVLDNGTVLLRDLTARSSIERAHLAHERVRNVAYSPAGDRLATTGPDGTVRIWDATGQLLKTFSAADPVTAVAFDRSARTSPLAVRPARSRFGMSDPARW